MFGCILPIHLVQKRLFCDKLYKFSSETSNKHGGISVANIKSQKKRNITNEKARLRNRAVRSKLKTATKEVREAVQNGNGAEAYAAALKTSRLMDKAVTKGVIHKNQAANRKSGIMQLANTVATAEDIAAYKPAEKKAPAKGGSKKAAAKAERNKAMAAASKEKAKNREKTEKSQASAAKKKADEEAKAAKEAAAAEAAAAKEAAEAAAAEAAEEVVAEADAAVEEVAAVEAVAEEAAAEKE
jgi:small subunit ribosomal protein S20